MPANQVATIPIETSCSAPAGASREDLAISLAPTTAIPEASAAPELDGSEGASEYGGPALDVGKRWEGTNCDPPGVDCGAGTYAKVTRHGDDLYFFVHVRDDFQSYAVKPAECVAHWFADSVEITIDLRGTASQTNMDTASRFKLASSSSRTPTTRRTFNGNGVNGPCWTSNLAARTSLRPALTRSLLPAHDRSKPAATVRSGADRGRRRAARPAARAPRRAASAR